MTLKTPMPFILVILLFGCQDSGRSFVDQDTTLNPKDLHTIEDQSRQDNSPQQDTLLDLGEDTAKEDVVFLDLVEMLEVTEDVPADILPDWCCNSDADCPGDFVCGPGNSCIAPLEPGQCFNDEDCYMIQTCVGATVCPCELLCVAPTMPGQCDPLPVSCCYTDSDCENGFLCRGQLDYDAMPGTCVPPPDSEICPYDAQCCWNDSDCGGDLTCFESHVCGCNELCPVCGQCMPDAPGWCG